MAYGMDAGAYHDMTGQDQDSFSDRRWSWWLAGLGQTISDAGMHGSNKSRERAHEDFGRYLDALEAAMGYVRAKQDCTAQLRRIGTYRQAKAMTDDAYEQAARSIDLRRKDAHNRAIAGCRTLLALDDSYMYSLYGAVEGRPPAQVGTDQMYRDSVEGWCGAVCAEYYGIKLTSMAVDLSRSSLTPEAQAAAIDITDVMDGTSIDPEKIRKLPGLSVRNLMSRDVIPVTARPTRRTLANAPDGSDASDDVGVPHPSAC